MTTQLIPVFTAVLNEQPEQLVNARDLHAFLEVGRDFSTWIKDRIASSRFIEGVDYSPVSGNRSDGKPGKQRIEYHLSLEMAKHLALMENNTVGDKVRRYFIAIERAARAANLELPLFVTPAQQRQLQDAIAARFPDGKQRPYAWGRFNAHFKLGSYKQLHGDQIDEALAYIAQMPDSTGNPPPSEVEAMAMERLRHARFVMYWDDKGRMMLREVPTGARVMSDEQIAGILADPGSMVDKKLLPGIIEAAAKRLAP